MPLTSVKEVLLNATKHRYGVAAVNVLSFETIKFAIKAAEAERVPIIIQYYPGFVRHCPGDHIAYMAKDLARKASVPVAVHLDHSATYEIAVAGLRDGFPSVMVDGSTLPFEQNVELTASVVRAARVFGVDVEAELGHVGSGANADDIENADHYTNVKQAQEFVERTGCDSLAIAVGNAHGAYIKKPSLDFDRIRTLRSILNIPLVLHGCSDIPDDQIQTAVQCGMSKFNIATEYFRAMYRALEKDIASKKKDGDGVGLMMGLEEPLVDFVVSKIRLLNPNKFSL